MFYKSFKKKVFDCRNVDMRDLIQKMKYWS